MTENRKRVLEMLSDGRVSVDEAERLLSLVDDEPESVRPVQQLVPTRNGPAKYLRVTVDSDDEHVNVRVPLALIKAGVKLHALVPTQAAEGINEALKRNGLNIDLHKLRADSLEELVDALSEIEIDVQDEDERVRVYCE